MKHLSFLALAGLLAANLVSCSSESKYYNPDSLVTINYPVPTDTLCATKLSINTKEAAEIACQDSFLFFLTQARKDFIGIYNFNADTSVMFIGERGEDEAAFADVYQPYSLASYSVDGNTYLFCSDYAKNRTAVIDVQASRNNQECVTNKVFEHEANVSYRFDIDGNMVYFNEVKTAVEGSKEYLIKPYYVIENKQGIDTLDIFSEVQADYKKMSQAYLAVNAISPDCKKYVRAYIMQDLIDIVDLQNHTVMGLKGKGSYGFEHFATFDEFAVYKLLAETLVCNNAYVALSNDRIYLLRFDIEVPQMENMVATKAFLPKLYMLDYNGKCLSSVILDQCVTRIAYSATENCLFGLDVNGAVYRFDF